MPPSRSRFVSGCQQLLVLGAVVAVLAPAASVISLDVVKRPVVDTTSSDHSALAAYVRSAQKTATVPTRPVEAVVAEHVLTPATGEAPARALRSGGATTLTSRPEPVSGYGAVGVTWEQGAAVPDDELGFEVRTRTDGAWSDWAELEYHDEHAPDPGTAEGRASRPGTEPMMIGEVDEVQVRTTDRAGALPADMRMAVIDPGTPEATSQERAALDTSTLARADVTGAEDPAGVDPGAEDGTLVLRSGEVTPEPVIYSRAQWGADESLRRGSTPSYGEVHAGFVHHTVNANDYTKDQVPAMLRSIYAYHTKSRGWSDVGYNYLVDRFGRIWEGRFGGIDRPVVGAHTLGYNEYSFAMSAIGNFETVRPSEAVVQAYGALFAWKLSLHGVDAGSMSQPVGKRAFPAVNGHRDAGSTACPGQFLYQRLGDIRRLADSAQADFEGRQLPADLADTPHPDLLARRASDGRVFVIPTGGLSRVRKPVAVSSGWARYDSVLLSDDVTGDGHPDALGVAASGAVDVRPGRDQGFDDTSRTATATEGRDLVTAVGDVDGDGRPDLVGRDGDRLEILAGRGDGRFRSAAVGGGWSGYDALAGSGDLDGDGYADLVARRTDGSLRWHRGSADGFGPALVLEGAGNGKGWDVLSGLGDWNGDGHADLFVRRTGGHGFVLPGRGDGTVGHPLGPIKRLKGRTGLAAGADVTGDGVPDLVFIKGDQLMRLAGTGKVETRAPIDSGVRIRAVDLLVNAGDWDGDGHGDLVLRKRKNGKLKMRPGDGAGGFGKAVLLARGFGDVRLLEAVGDVTGDGRPDLMGQPAGGSMRIYPGQGAGLLGPGYVARSAISATRQIGVGLWDGDGAPDSMFRQGDALVAYPGNGPGGLTDPRRVDLDLSRYDLVTGIGDADLKGRADLVLRETATGHLWLLEGKGSGFKAPRFLAEGAEVYDLVD